MNRNLVPMTQLIERISMGPFGSDIKTECFVNAGVPVLNGGNLTTIRMNDDSFNFVTKEKANSLSKSIARRGDIVVTHRGTLGQLSYIPEDSQYEEYLISQSQFCVTLNTDLVDPIYFAYYFHSPEGQKRLLSFANYVGVPALASATTNFKNLEFPLISLGEQKEIVNKILCIENKIRNNTSICSDLESMAKLLYDYWFVQFDFPDENGRPYKSSGGKMVWNDELKREIPEGWDVNHISDYLDVITGKEDANFATSNGKYAFFTCSDDILKCDIPKFKGKAVLVAGNGNFNVKYFEGEFNAYQRTYVLLPKDEKYVGLLYYNVLQSINLLTKNAVGSIVKFITKSDVDNIVMLDGNKNDLLKPFNQIVTQIQYLQKENQELASLRDFLLPMLMNGQIKIEDVRAS